MSKRKSIKKVAVDPEIRRAVKLARKWRKRLGIVGPATPGHVWRLWECFQADHPEWRLRLSDAERVPVYSHGSVISIYVGADPYEAALGLVELLAYPICEVPPSLLVSGRHFRLDVNWERPQIAAAFADAFFGLQRGIVQQLADWEPEPATA